MRKGDHRHYPRGEEDGKNERIQEEGLRRERRRRGEEWGKGKDNTKKKKKNSRTKDPLDPTQSPHDSQEEEDHDPHEEEEKIHDYETHHDPTGACHFLNLVHENPLVLLDPTRTHVVSFDPNEEEEVVARKVDDAHWPCHDGGDDPSLLVVEGRKGEESSLDEKDERYPRVDTMRSWR